MIECWVLKHAQHSVFLFSVSLPAFISEGATWLPQMLLTWLDWGGTLKSQNKFRLQIHSIVQNNCHLNSERLEISVLRIWFKANKKPLWCQLDFLIIVPSIWLRFWPAAANVNHTLPSPSLPSPNSLSLRTREPCNWKRELEILVQRTARETEEKKMEGKNLWTGFKHF